MSYSHKLKLPGDIEAKLKIIRARNSGSACNIGGRNGKDSLYQPPSADNGDMQNDGRPEGISVNDFHAYMPVHQYIFAPSRELWPATSVNARLPKMEAYENGEIKQISASAWLDRNQPVEQMTWAPGMPMINRLIASGGWIERRGVKVFNLYRPPSIALGDPTKAGPWLEHLGLIISRERHAYPHVARSPGAASAGEINHAILLGGPQGIGKDTLLEPVKYAVGPWNFAEVAPHQLLGRFNGYLKSVILRVSEAKDLGDVDRFTLYDHVFLSNCAASAQVARNEYNGPIEDRILRYAQKTADAWAELAAKLKKKVAEAISLQFTLAAR